MAELEDLSGRCEAWEPPAGAALDGAGHRALVAAAKAHAAAEDQMRAAVALARELGYSWQHIGILTGLGEEQARQLGNAPQ